MKQFFYLPIATILGLTIICPVSDLEGLVKIFTSCPKILRNRRSFSRENPLNFPFNKREILGWSDDEIKQDLLEQRIEKAAASELENTQNVIKLIRKLSENRTLIVITHDSQLLEHMDRLIYFDKGKIIKDEML